MFYVSMGGFAFQMVGASFLSEGRGGHPMGGIGFGVGGVLKKIVRWGAPPNYGKPCLLFLYFILLCYFCLCTLPVAEAAMYVFERKSVKENEIISANL